MVNILSLQELKRTGFNKLKTMFKDEPDILIQERGKDACVLVEIEHYNYLRTCELEVALLQAKKDIHDGKFYSSVDSHITRLELDN